MSRVEKIVSAKPTAIILREKDLLGAEYKSLAEQVLGICGKSVQCILHTHVAIAKELGAPVHLPMPVLREAGELPLKFGASCHSLDEALEAERLGASYITAGHIFETDCKAGTPGRGLKFLQEICCSVSIPVYAIGGINKENIGNVLDAGAKGACVMSGAMTCGNVDKYISELKLH